MMRKFFSFHSRRTGGVKSSRRTFGGIYFLLFLTPRLSEIIQAKGRHFSKQKKSPNVYVQVHKTASILKELSLKQINAPAQSEAKEARALNVKRLF